ncbi:MAG: cell division protein FtsA [Candidatus Nealsonbacteria bacterium]|nr:cell division protein FtsA [Candidatus Nealsonbacteria bacterium]
MARPYIINALDIGSSSIKLVSVLKKPKSYEVLAQAQEASFGVRKGVVMEVSKVSEIISSLVKRIEEDSGKKVDGVYASVGGSHLFSAPSKGLVSVSRADRKISKEDTERVLQAAETLSIPSNNEIMEVFPKDFIVDGQAGVKEAVGMNGVRLEADVTVLGGFTPYLRNSNKSISSSGVNINYIYPDFLASSKAVLSSREKELGVCVLDIGGGTTGMSVYEEGSLVHGFVFPIGSAYITNDIAVCLKTDIDTAEKIKIEFGSCRRSGVKKSEKKINISGEEPIVFSRKALSEIIEARVCEIFDLVHKELKKISKSELPAGVVLTGGGAKIPGIKDLAKKELKLPVRIGRPTSLIELDDPALATVCGLVLEASDMEEEDKGAKSGFLSFFRKFFKSFVP